MKKLFFLFALLLLIPVLLFAQDEVPDVPGTVGDFLDDPARFLKQLAGLIGLTIFIVGNIIRWRDLKNQYVKVAIAVVTAAVLSALTNLINYGLFADSLWLDTFIWGAGIGAVAGGLADIPTMKLLVNLILSAIRFKKPE